MSKEVNSLQMMNLQKKEEPSQKAEVFNAIGLLYRGHRVRVESFYAKEGFKLPSIGLYGSIVKNLKDLGHNLPVELIKGKGTLYLRKTPHLLTEWVKFKKQDKVVTPEGKESNYIAARVGDKINSYDLTTTNNPAPFGELFFIETPGNAEKFVRFLHYAYSDRVRRDYSFLFSKKDALDIYNFSELIFNSDNK
tara:strand:+ start:116 stop:694 length:579 start_codon:yes stop_codon:yes gene_type:complete